MIFQACALIINGYQGAQMGYTILSIIIFAISLYIFYVTNKKVQSIKDEAISSEMRQEMDALITEFNRTATRNIEILEDKIEELSGQIVKADKRLLNLDEKISRANRPIVVEKIVEKESPVPEKTKKEKIPQDSPGVPEEREIRKPVFQAPLPEPVPPQKEKEEKSKALPQSRSDELKELMRKGHSEQELMDMGYQLNEIKLLKFLIK